MNRCKIQSATCTKYHAKQYCHKHYKQVESHGRTFTDAEIKAHYAKTKGVRLNTGRTHFKKGHNSWNAGLKNWLSEEHKAALRLANSGNAWTKGKKRPDIVGEKNPMWKGGVKSQNDMDRVKFRKQVQQLVLQRDNYTCQVCDQYSGNLQVDHIKSWADFPDLRFELDNCRTLCMACHYYVTFKRKMPKGIVWGHNLKQRIT